METRIITLSAQAPHDAVFNFLADIENLPAWTGGFCEWLQLQSGGWCAYTALGELSVETKVDDIAWQIDLRLSLNDHWSLVIPLRVQFDGKNAVLITVTCRQPAAMAERDYECWFESLLAGLRTLPEKFPILAGV